MYLSSCHYFVITMSLFYHYRLLHTVMTIPYPHKSLPRYQDLYIALSARLAENGSEKTGSVPVTPLQSKL
jgi:hypothetical protein